MAFPPRSEWEGFFFAIEPTVGANREKRHKENVYRRTFKEDRPRLAEVFLAIIEWFSFAEFYKFYNLQK